MLRSFRQNERVFKACESGAKASKIFLPAIDEVGKLRKLRKTKRRLHIGSLQVVADVRVGVLVIVSAGERSNLPIKPLATGIIPAGFTPAVTPPVAKRLDQSLQVRFIGQNCAAFSHCYVVSGI